jgi:hypothetical protein
MNILTVGMKTHSWKGDIMLIFRLLIGLIVLIVSLPKESFAVVEWTQGDYVIGNNSGWDWIPALRTYNDVTVKMYDGGVHQFYMYDNSLFSIYGPGSVDYLYLYENTSVSFFGSTYMDDLYIDPANTGWVKLYAYDVTFQPHGSFPGEGTIHGRWTGNKMTFNIDLVGSGAYSHIQIIPEPVTLALFGMGTLALRRRK